MSDPATTTPRGSPLTPQERRCLLEASRTRTYAIAAANLGLSRHTFKAYMRNACFRLNVATGRQAIAKALRLGLLNGDSLEN